MATKTVEQTQVVIFGAGEFARLMFGYIRELEGHRIEGFIVDDSYWEPERDKFLGQHVVPLSRIRDAFDVSRTPIVAATSGSRLSERRVSLHRWAESQQIELFTYISPRAYVAPDAQIGAGSIVLENCVVQSGVSLGPVSVLWSGNHVGHLSRLGLGCFLTSHVVVGGAATLGDRCYLGMNSVIRDGVVIGSHVVVGAMTYVDKSFGSDVVIQGNPARLLKDADPMSVVR